MGRIFRTGFVFGVADSEKKVAWLNLLLGLTPVLMVNSVFELSLWDRSGLVDRYAGC